MNAEIDITGHRYGCLVVLWKADTPRKWVCQCDCGNRTLVISYSLRGGTTRSCGCLRVEFAKKSFTRHGDTDSKEYYSWYNMQQRCYNPKNRSFKHYGGRGISICERWDLYENFLADMGRRPKGLILDRIDNEKNYEPSNCWWTTRSQSNKNRRPFDRNRQKAFMRSLGCPR
jgi:hypothetical protein